MTSIREILEAIGTVRIANPSQAEQRLASLIVDLGPIEVEKWLPDIESTISLFFKKRQKRLVSTLDEVRQKGKRGNDDGGESKCDELDLEDFRLGLDQALAELSESHIFQWPTYYRDWVGEAIEKMLSLGERKQQAALNIFQESVATHTKEIFEKGFHFKVYEQRRAEEAAHATALSGLQRFADLAVEHYSGGAIKETKGLRRVALRRATSRLLTGIFSGFILCNFNTRTGAQVLASSRVRWFHYLTFIDEKGILDLTSDFGNGSIAATLGGLIKPLACALDRCAEMATGSNPLPQVSQYFHEKRRLEVLCVSSSALRLGAKAEVFALLDAELPALPDLKEAEARDIKLIICSLKPDVAKSPQAERIQERIVDTNETGQTTEQFEQRACAILSGFFGALSQGDANAVLEHNFAKIFPLNNPFQTKYFHVVRKSVRNLLQGIEGRNGVRLWCSARRSGKTTACNDLSGSLASSETVFQTCEVLKEDDLSGRFYGRLLDCLEDQRPVGRRFLADIIDEVRQGASPAGRIVLVIDEYETLFGRLQGAVNQQEDLKYSIVFPLLDQVVEFARENMVILVGQQPNAHFVFMDQNKLSAYVTQDSFPLFNHKAGSTVGEFVDLLAKVLSERFSFTASFADSLFEETAGHPYLTVNLLVSIVEWLISIRTRIVDIRFNSDLLARYFESEMDAHKIALNTQYQFFIEAASDAMSDRGRRSNSWLWSVYRAMRMFVSEYGALGRCTIAEFSVSYERHGCASARVSALDLLRTADDANFFKVDSEGFVRTGIPLLARIASSATPRI